MFKSAVKKYGSEAAARKWVLPANESHHVLGIALDVIPQSGATWLQKNGKQWGLCRMYVNEWWHFEYNPSYTSGCPALRADASVGEPR